MTGFSTFCFVLAMSLAAPADEVKPDHQLVGSWKLASAKYDGKDHKLQEGYTHIKHVTPTQFMWAIYNKDGKADLVLGGSYTLAGDKYEEMPEYGVGQVLPLLKGKPQTFTWKVEENKWFHTGKLTNGVKIEEV